MPELFSMGPAASVQLPTVGEWLLRLSHDSYKRVMKRVHPVVSDNGVVVANVNYNADIAVFDSRLNKGLREVDVGLPTTQAAVGLMHGLGDITDDERARLLAPGLLPGETGERR